MGKNLTKEQQKMIFLVLLFVGGGWYVYWNYLLKPTNQKIATTSVKLKDLQGQIERAERQSRRLPALEAEYKQLQIELAGLEKQLPKSQDLPNILRMITKEAQRENLEFQRLTPKPATQQNYFEVIPFDIQFSGSLHSLARFLASLGQQDRIFKTENVSLAPLGALETAIVGVPLSISLTIQTYAYRG